MVSRHLIEKRKGGTGEFYLMRVIEATGIKAAAEAVAGEFAPGDTIRVSILSVEVAATRNADETWTVIASK